MVVLVDISRVARSLSALHRESAEGRREEGGREEEDREEKDGEGG